MKYLTIQIQPKDLDKLPPNPGVYMFCDKDDKILYIGKAKALNKRVRSYFSSSVKTRPYILKMMPLVSTIKYIQTNTEVDALILEASLIKKHKPHYNQELKDDKSYAWIYINTQEKFPTVKIVRRLNNKEFKNGKLFGPYPSGKTIKMLYKYIRTLYPFCTCSAKKSHSCLYVQIGLCPGPYQGLITEEKYRQNIQNIIELLSGKNPDIIQKLKEEMCRYADSANFEKAIELRDKIRTIEYISQKIDITPFTYERKLFNEQKIREELNYLTNILSIKKIERIECYDISHLRGNFTYGSMSVFNNGILDKSQYRLFKLEGIRQDDFNSLLEVLKRRIKHIQKDKKDISLNAHPDIILIDGDIHQLSKLKHIVPDDILLVGISKGRYRRRQGYHLQDEFWIFKNGKIKQIFLEKRQIFTSLRDEAHRFALTHNKKARIQHNLESELIKIKGIGPKRLNCLLKSFCSIKQIKKAPLNKINKCLKNRQLSKHVLEYLNEDHS